MSNSNDLPEILIKSHILFRKIIPLSDLTQNLKRLITLLLMLYRNQQLKRGKRIGQGLELLLVLDVLQIGNMRDSQQALDQWTDGVLFALFLFLREF